MRSMQRLDLMRVPCALVYIPDESQAKRGHSKYQQFLVEAQDDADGHVMRDMPGQGLDTAVPIMRCTKAVKGSVVGSRYRMVVKVADVRSLGPYIKWQNELAELARQFPAHLHTL